MNHILIASIASLWIAFGAGRVVADDNPLEVGATVYYDYLVDLNDHEDGDQTPTHGFVFRRAYLTVTKEVGDVGFRYTSDIDAKYGTGNLNAFTKYAYMEHSGWISGAKVLMGLHSPKTHGWVEKRWHYRSMAKTMADANEWTNAAELGIGLQGKVADGKVEYYLDVNNGNGYKKPLHKDGMGLAARIAGEPSEGFHVSGMFSSNAVGTYDDDGEVAGSDDADTYLEGLAGYEDDRFGLFGQYGLFQNGPSDVKSSGLSAFGRVAVTDGLYGVARFDVVDPDTDTDKDGKNFLLVGLDHRLGKGLNVQPSVRVTSFEADSIDSEKEFVVTLYGKI